jgi:predicted dehydrogenase
MAEDTIKIGIIGAGDNTRVMHIPGLQAIAGVDLAGVCNRSKASSEKVSAQFGISRVYEDWKDLIAAEDIDAIVIGTWPYRHCEFTLAALAEGKHVLCEARMAMNLAEARQMVEAAAAHPELITQIVPSPMTLRVDKTIKRLIGEGYLGTLLAIECRDGNSLVDHDGPMHWRQDVALSGLNIMSMGIWYEAMLRWVGPAKSVFAQGQVVVKTRKEADGKTCDIKVPDHLDVVMELAGGAQGHIQISTVTGFARPAEVFLFGSDGTLRYSENTLYGAQRGDEQLQEIAIQPGDEESWRVEEEFINAIRGKEKIRLTPFDEGLKYMAFTEAVTRSMESGQRIEVESL